MNLVATYLSLFPFPYSQVYGSLENQQSFHVETMVKINDLLAKKKAESGWNLSKGQFPENSHYLTCLEVPWKIPLEKLYLT